MSTALLLAAALAAGCGGGEGDADDDREASRRTSPSPPHGYVEGAKEAAEQQSRLVLADPGTGEARVLDLISEKVHTVPAVPDAAGLTTDGRFGFFHTARETQVLDTGAWMVDHGDHVHYYRARIREVGRLPDGGARIRGDAAVTVVTAEDGDARLYRRDALEDGRIGDARPLEGPHAAPVIPYGGHLITLGSGRDAGVTVRDRDGEETAALDATCRDPRGDAVTRRGIVFGCAEGALLVREASGTFEAVEIPYPRDVPEDERATAFRLRPGSDTLTAPAGREAVWVLDVTERTWQRVATGPVLAANTAGEGAPLLALGTDGTLRGFDTATGERTGEEAGLDAAPIAADPGPGVAGSPVIAVDNSRAYVSDPAGGRVHEIDYNDGLRVARTFDLDIEPGLMVETGR